MKNRSGKGGVLRVFGVVALGLVAPTVMACASPVGDEAVAQGQAALTPPADAIGLDQLVAELQRATIALVEAHEAGIEAPEPSALEKIALESYAKMEQRHRDAVTVVREEIEFRRIPLDQIGKRLAEIFSAGSAESRAAESAFVAASGGRITVGAGGIGPRAFPIVIPVISFLAGYLAGKALDAAIEYPNTVCGRIERQTKTNCDIIERNCRASGQNPGREDIGTGTGCNFYCFVYCGGRRYSGRLNRWYEGMSQEPSTAPY